MTWDGKEKGKGSEGYGRREMGGVKVGRARREVSGGAGKRWWVLECGGAKDHSPKCMI